jgi:enoyl-CoA hydratase/carnithine racemase
VPRDELAGRVNALADTLLRNSPEALSATKRLIAAQNKDWLNAAIVDGIKANAEARTTQNFGEGIAAFLEKRKPAWKK